MNRDLAGRSRGASLRVLRDVAMDAVRRYPLTDPSVRLVRLRRDATYRVSSEEGTFAMRVGDPEQQTAAALTSEMVYRRSLAATTPVAVPTPVQSVDGADVVDAAAGGVQRACTLVTWLPGRKHTASPASWQAHALGAAMAHLHRHAASFDPPPGFERMTWDATRVTGRLTVGARATLERMVEPSSLSIIDRATGLVDGVFAAIPRAPSHWGLINANLGPRDTLWEGRNIGLVDFGDVGWGPFSYDLATTWGSYRGRKRGAATAAALVDGYTSVAPLPGDFEANLETMLVGRQLRLIHYLATRIGEPMMPKRLRDFVATLELQLLDWDTYLAHIDARAN